MFFLLNEFYISLKDSNTIFTKALRRLDGTKKRKEL